jgi:uncharacterized membrane protein
MAVPGDQPTMVDEQPTAADVVEKLESLEESVDSPDERRKVRRIRRLGEQLYRLEQETLGNVEQRIQRYTTRDVVEAFVGSTLFSLPLHVEGGVQEIGEHFATSLVYGVPVYFLLNLAFVATVTGGLLYYAEFREVELTFVFGVVPRRLAAVLLISFFTAAATMALWGRLDPSDPFLAVCQVSVVWTAGAFGAGLGDILPGQSEGPDIEAVIESLD